MKIKCKGCGKIHKFIGKIPTYWRCEVCNSLFMGRKIIETYTAILPQCF